MLADSGPGPTTHRLPPVLGAVLIGGTSSRMGRPKQLMPIGNRPMVAIAVEALQGLVGEVVLVGGGEVPRGLQGLERLADPPDVSGPMGGVLAAMRWAPAAAWVVLACDMPRVSDEAVRWLLSQRGPGVTAILPRPSEDAVAPMLAVYEPGVKDEIEALAAAGRWGLRRLAGLPGVCCPQPPEDLAPAWESVDTLEQFTAASNLNV